MARSLNPTMRPIAAPEATPINVPSSARCSVTQPKYGPAQVVDCLSYPTHSPIAPPIAAPTVEYFRSETSRRDAGDVLWPRSTAMVRSEGVSAPLVYNAVAGNLEVAKLDTHRRARVELFGSAEGQTRSVAHARAAKHIMVASISPESRSRKGR